MGLGVDLVKSLVYVINVYFKGTGYDKISNISGMNFLFHDWNISEKEH